jgi:signal transduction histidine kinase
MRALVRSLLRRGGLVVVSVALAVPMTLLLPPLEQAPYALFFAAVVVSAWYGGSWASLLATALSALALDLFFLPPIYAVGTDLADGVRLGAFVLAGALIGLFQGTRERFERSLREREQRRAEFLAVMAHELRNFLSPLTSAVGVMRGGDMRGQDAERCLEIVERQVRNMGRLVNDLLDASRLEHGKLRLRKGPVDLAAVVGQAVEAARPAAEARGHQLTVDLPPGPLPLQADATRLEQVLMNLLTNAARYTEPGGRITVSVGRLRDEAMVRVRDTGVGIAPEVLPNLFDLFAQANNGSHGGLGVGLQLVRGLVQLHGGTVAAFSKGLGQGSEFVVRLPLAEAGRECERVSNRVAGAAPPAG